MVHSCPLHRMIHLEVAFNWMHVDLNKWHKVFPRLLLFSPSKILARNLDSNGPGYLTSQRSKSSNPKPNLRKKTQHHANPNVWKRGTCLDLTDIDNRQWPTCIQLSAFLNIREKWTEWRLWYLVENILDITVYYSHQIGWIIILLNKI